MQKLHSVCMVFNEDAFAVLFNEIVHLAKRFKETEAFGCYLETNYQHRLHEFGPPSARTRTSMSTWCWSPSRKSSSTTNSAGVQVKVLGCQKHVNVFLL